MPENEPNPVECDLLAFIAVSIGGVVPLLLRRFRQEAAAASGPLLTKITTMTGSCPSWAWPSPSRHDTSNAQGWIDR